VAGCSPVLAAAPRLVSTWPTPGATLPVAKMTVEFVFNRALDPAGSWAQLTTGDGGRASARVVVDPNDPRRLTVRMLEPGPGSVIVHWQVSAMDSHLTTDGDTPFSLDPSTPAPPRIDVSPPQADTNDRLELVGKGFPANAVVPLVIGDDDQPLALANTDAAGRFNLEAHVPETVPYGLQRISAFDDSRRVAATTVQVQWGGWPPVVGRSVGVPGPEPDEVTFTLNLRNRSDYVLEHVRVVLPDPEASQVVATDADAQQQDAALIWEIPVMDRGLARPLHVTYRTDHAITARASVEFRHRKERGCYRGDCLPAFISTSVVDSEPTAPTF
jgi:methionine-rich copper-binding protein CopC